VNFPRRALISVTDKSGIADFARGLVEIGFEIISTGGTARILREANIEVTDVSSITDFPEILDGRVKTLHPKIHGGVLARKHLDSDVSALKEHGIAPFELVVVNLYAFEKAAANAELELRDVLEQIDIGGPTLLRAAAKNFHHVLPVTDPEDYSTVLSGFSGDEDLSDEQRLLFARKVFKHTSVYDHAVSQYLDLQTEDGTEFEQTKLVRLDKVQSLRYGENPHQSAAFYTRSDDKLGALANTEQLHGKALSYNNLLDADSAWNLALDLGQDSAVYIKHNNPCGAARHPDLLQALTLARAVDPVSAFGSVVAIGKSVNAAAATFLAETFIEVIMAPSFSEEAKAILMKKKNLRLLEMGTAEMPKRLAPELRCVSGGVLVQNRDYRNDPASEVADAKVVTTRKPSAAELEALKTNWLVAKHVRSNAIVFGHADRVVAVGAGQMSRIDSVKLCQLKGGDALKGSVVASDAFFPFRDGVDALAEAGATAIVQPGGSVRDEEVIDAANEHGLAMLMTGFRHFRH